MNRSWAQWNQVFMWININYKISYIRENIRRRSLWLITLHQNCRYFSLPCPNSPDNIANTDITSGQVWSIEDIHHLLFFIIIYFLIVYSAQIKQQFNKYTACLKYHPQPKSWWRGWEDKKFYTETQIFFLHFMVKLSIYL